MVFHSQDKNKLLQAAIKIYHAYLALDFFKSQAFILGAQKKTLYELCHQAIIGEYYQQTVTIEQLHYELLITPRADSGYSIHLKRLIQEEHHLAVKTPAAYSPREMLGLLSSQHFIFYCDDQKIALANQVTLSLKIGGLNTIELYRSHLVTLYYLIERLTNENTLDNWLVALPNGYGKTYFQAVWMHVLLAANMHGVFLIAKEQSVSFHTKIQHIISSECNVLFLESTDEAKIRLKQLRYPRTKATIIVATSELLLDIHFKSLALLPAERTVFAIDDQHLLMADPQYHYYLIALAQQKRTLFLTAYPSEETYLLSQHGPVALRSRKHQHAAGNGVFPRLIQIKPPTLIQKNQLFLSQFGTEKFRSTLNNRLLLALNEARHDEHYSFVALFFEHLLSYQFDKEEEYVLRWRKQVPVARNMLCFIDDKNALINFYHNVLHKGVKGEVYTNNTLTTRSTFTNLVNSEPPFLLRPFKEQLKYNLMHRLLEYVLTENIGFSVPECNYWRKHRFNALYQRMCAQFEYREACYYQQQLAPHIDERGSRLLGALLAELSQFVQYTIEQQDRVKITALIDNWVLDDQLIDSITSLFPKLNAQFERYAIDYLVLSVMSEIKNGQTVVLSAKPCTRLRQKSRLLNEHDCGFWPVLTDFDPEIEFVPDYLAISEAQANNYFRLGLVGLYVTNKKAEDFYNPNVDTVISLCANTAGITNDPGQLMQRIALMRGLDETIEPVFIQGLGAQQHAFLNIHLLDDKDYYPALFAAQKEYETSTITALNKIISQKVLLWLDTCYEKKWSISSEQLMHQLYSLTGNEIDVFNKIHSKMFSFHKEQTKQLMSYLVEVFQEEIERIKHPVRLSWMWQCLIYLTHGVNTGIQTVQSIPVIIRSYYYTTFNFPVANKAQSQANALYLKILHTTCFATLRALSPTLSGLQRWFEQQFKDLAASLKINNLTCLHSDASHQFTQYYQNTWIPLLVHSVVEEKKVLVAQALVTFPEALNFFYRYSSSLATLFQPHSGVAPYFKQSILEVLHEIPALHALQEHDVINYPQYLIDNDRLFALSPIRIVAQNELLYQALCVRLMLYFNREFITQLSSLLDSPQYKTVAALLTQLENARLFAVHYIALRQSHEVDSLSFLLRELSLFFKISPLEITSNESVAIMSSIKQKIIHTFLGSTLVRDALRFILNEADYRLIVTLLSEDKYLSELVELLVNDNCDLLQPLVLLDKLRSYYPHAAAIISLSQRIHDLRQMIDAFAKEPQAYLHKETMAQHAAHAIAPILFHSSFIKLIKLLQPILNEHDLSVLLIDSLRETEVADKVTNLLRLIAIVRRQDKQALTHEFLMLAFNEERYDLENHPLIKALDLFNALVTEVLNCHRHFNQYAQGDNEAILKPQLYKRLSVSLKQLTVPPHWGLPYVDKHTVRELGIFLGGMRAAEQLYSQRHQRKIALLIQAQHYLQQPEECSFWQAFICRSWQSLKEGVLFVLRVIIAWGQAINEMMGRIGRAIQKQACQASKDNSLNTAQNNSCHQSSLLMHKVGAELKCASTGIRFFSNTITKQQKRLELDDTSTPGSSL